MSESFHFSLCQNQTRQDAYNPWWRLITIWEADYFAWLKVQQNGLASLLFLYIIDVLSAPYHISSLLIESKLYTIISF
jgi:hypothetical protein